MENGNGRMDRVEMALDRLATLTLETAERQSATENSLGLLTSRVDSFITSTHDWQEAMTRGQKQLLASQVLLTDEQRKLAEQARETLLSLRALAEKVSRTEESLNALIRIVDDIIRRDRPRN